MQISINIQDDLYKKVLNSGVDMQTKFNEYLSNLFDKKDMYLNSQQFQDDKKYFNNALEEIESGKIDLVPFNDGLNELDDFIDNIK